MTRLCLDHLKSARVRRETYPGPWLPEPLLDDQARLPVDTFVRAVGSGDLGALKALFAEDVTFVGDGGGKARAARKVVRGRDAVARGTLGGVRHLNENARIEHVDVNGWPGLAVWVGERLGTVLSIECDDHQIHAIHVVVNPDKLRR